MRDLIELEYDAGIISREQMIELINILYRIYRSVGSHDQVMQLKETLLQELQLTHQRSKEIMDDIDYVINILQNFR